MIGKYVSSIVAIYPDIIKLCVYNTYVRRFDDLLVGAPLYYTDSLPEVGTVYIYENQVIVS